MKNAKLFLRLSALAVLVCSLSWGQPFAVAQQDSDPAAPTAQQPEQPQQPDDSMNPEADLKFFIGKVMKSGETLVLKDSVSQSTYKLDDQDRAKSFEGKNVKVTGTLDAATRTIRVASIEIEPGS